MNALAPEAAANPSAPRLDWSQFTGADGHNSWQAAGARWANGPSGYWLYNIDPVLSDSGRVVGWQLVRWGPTGWCWWGHLFRTPNAAKRKACLDSENAARGGGADWRDPKDDSSASWRATPPPHGDYSFDYWE